MTTPIFQIPPVAPQDWLILGLLALTASSALIAALLPRTSALADPLDQLRTALGLSTLPRLVVLAGTLLWGILLVVLVGSLVWTLFDIRHHLAPTENRAEALRGLLVTLTAMTATLGAVVAFPVTLTRIRQSQKANDLTDERLFNDKLNEASKNLAAWRDVTTVLGTGDDRKTITTREPDLITRAAAIDRLYGLVEERPSEVNRIASLLSLYVRENTVPVGDKEPDVPPEEPPEGATPEEFRGWAVFLRAKRSDLQHAVQTLGKFRNILGANISDTAIDLSGANLQGFELNELNFGKSIWEGANLQGVYLHRSNFDGADFAFADLQGSSVTNCTFRGAKFLGTNFNTSLLYDIDSGGTEISGIIFDLPLSPADLRLQGASIRYRDLDSVNFDFTLCEIIFGDGTNIVSPFPEHWPQEELDEIDFILAWREWVSENHPDVLQYLPKDPRE